ncbi:hypothetical protein EV175_000161 [Coemansia sp. RSA 1933]|nr:hypothetical protein EV175_000161 [Coemansia sp. RSA 1933]
MFSKTPLLRQQRSVSETTPTSAGDHPLLTQDSVVQSINRLEPATDESRPTSRNPVGREYGKHEVLKEFKSSPTSSLSLRSASASKGGLSPDDETGGAASFPSTGFSRSRRVSSRTTVSRKASSIQQQSSSAAPSEPSRESDKETNETDKDVDSCLAPQLLPHDSLGRKLWLRFQAAPDLADIRDMVADSATGVLVLPQTPHRSAGEPDVSAMLNDNVLFTDSPYAMDNNSNSNASGVYKFTTVSGICGTIDRGSVSALGTLPAMEDIMQMIGNSDSPRTTIFDVLGADMMAAPPLVRLRVVTAKGCKLPDGRTVQVVITSGLLERSLVVDSAVTTLAARIHDAIDATYGAMLPQSAESITACDTIRVAIEAIIQYAHAVEVRRPPADAKSRPFAWIAGQRTKSHTSTTTHAPPGPVSEQLPAPTADSDNWQALMAQLQSDISDYLARLERETSMCGDSESRKAIGASLIECVEKLVTESIYLQIFSPPHHLSQCDDRAQDEQLASKVAALNVADITLEHLGLPVLPATPRAELLRICVETGRLLDRMNAVKSPAEKLKFVVDAHKGVVDRMQRLNERIHSMEARKRDQGDQNEDGKSTAVLAADSILPLLIYSLVKANPAKFISNLRYIQRYRTQSLLASQFEYCLTNALAAASFIDSVDAKQLGLTAELSSSVLERAMPPALAALHNLLVNNVVSNVGMEVVQGVADGGRKVAVGVFDATLGKLIDTSSQLIFKGGWRSPSEREMQQQGAEMADAEIVDEKTVDQDNVILGVRNVLNSASVQLSHEIKGHLPRRASTASRSPTSAPPKINERFLAVQAEDLTIKEVSQLLASYKELAKYMCK